MPTAQLSITILVGNSNSFNIWQSRMHAGAALLLPNNPVIGPKSPLESAQHLFKVQNQYKKKANEAGAAGYPFGAIFFAATREIKLPKEFPTRTTYQPRLPLEHRSRLITIKQRAYLSLSLHPRGISLQLCAEVCNLRICQVRKPLCEHR